MPDMAGSRVDFISRPQITLFDALPVPFIIASFHDTAFSAIFCLWLQTLLIYLRLMAMLPIQATFFIAS